MVHHDSSSRGCAESKQDAEHPERTHDDDDEVICVTAEENHVIKMQNADGQRAAEGASSVKLQEIISVIDQS